MGFTHLSIEHCIVQLVVWPAQFEVPLDERGAISIGGVDLFDCITLGRATAYQSEGYFGAEDSSSRRVLETKVAALPAAAYRLRRE